MEKIEVKKSIARSVTEHTILAAYTTIDCYGVPSEVTTELEADLHELEQMESSSLVDAAQTLVKIAIAHSISPTETTYAEARAARDALGDLMIRTKEVRG